jgi:SAM-dependent methyltransferase
MDQAIRLNLGCGNKRKEGFLGIDKFPCAAVDLVADITEPLPFEDSSVSEVWADNVIEHVQDIPALMSEVHRICRDGAEVTLITPHYTSISSWNDPTHVHHLSYFSMDHFSREAVAHYTGGGFQIVARRLSFPGGMFGLMGRLAFAVSAKWWESRLSFMFRASTLRFRLRVIKAASAKDMSPLPVEAAK